MPQTCSICRSPRRKAVDAALVAGESLRSIAKRFGTSQSAVFRHRKNDLSPALIRANQDRESEHAEGLINQMQSLLAKTLAILDKAENQRTALVAVREARGNIELLARLTGELQAAPAPHDAPVLFSLPPGSGVNISIQAPRNEIDVTPKSEGRQDGC